jgi:hypothetical protein
MKKMLITVALALSFLVASVSPALAAEGITIPFQGTVVGGGTKNGRVTIHNFRLINGKIFAAATFVTSVTDQATGTVKTGATKVLVPVVASSIASTRVGTEALCPILHLELGPLDLDLLGVLIHLNRVVLDITAQSGPGNLLGNLLCGIVGILDPPTPLLISLLNQILGLLG